jgi:hypothetical protein
LEALGADAEGIEGLVNGFDAMLGVSETATGGPDEKEEKAKDGQGR